MNNNSLHSSSKKSKVQEEKDEAVKENEPTQKEDFTYRVEYMFSNEPYVCVMKTPNNSSLFISVERQATLDQWCGEFSVQDVENMTTTARNFKSFKKFVQMLFDALQRKSSSVTLELLTRSQLEIVCQKNLKKKSSTGNTAEILNRTSLMSSLKENNNQRYLDMVYHVEYDCVHYPLPLSYVKPDAERLRKKVQMLRDENNKLKEENIMLRSKIKSSKDHSLQADGEHEKLKKDYEKIKKDYRSLKQAFEQLERDSVKELTEVKKECENLTADYVAQKNEIINLKQHVEGGENSLKEIKQLKKQIRKLTEGSLLKDQLLKKKDNEISLFREDLMKVTKSEKKWIAESEKLSLKLGKLINLEERRSSRLGSNSPSRSRSFSPENRSRPSSAPKSYTRFDPTAYVAKKSTTKKASLQATKASSKNSSRNASRSSSIERSTKDKSNGHRLSGLSSGSEKENYVKKGSRKTSRSSTPPREWSRSPKIKDKHNESKLDHRLLKNKLKELAKKPSTVTRKPPVPTHNRRATKKKIPSSIPHNDSIYFSSDYKTSDDERIEAYYRSKRKLSSKINTYDTSDSSF